METMTEAKFIGVKGLQERWGGVPASTVYAIPYDDLPFMRQGKYKLYALEDVEAYEAAKREEARRSAQDDEVAW